MEFLLSDTMYFGVRESLLYKECGTHEASKGASLTPQQPRFQQPQSWKKYGWGQQV